MTSPIHSRQTIADGIHTPIAYTFVDEAARLALAATAFDLNKFVFQQSDGTVWMLTSVLPNVWQLVSAVGGQGADKYAAYLVTNATGSLPNERAFVSGIGINTTDVSGSFTVKIDTNVVATTSGSVFSGPVIFGPGATLNAKAGISGSHTVLSDGTTPFMVPSTGNPITITTGSNGQIILSGSFTPLGSAYVTIGNDASLTAERSLTAGTGISIVDGGANSTVTLNVNNNIVATLTGSTFTGPLKALAGISGSHTVLGDGSTSFIIPASGNPITITTGSNGQIILSGSFTPIGSSYVTIGSDASLTAERSLTAGTGISIVDGGANSTVTLNINNNVVATLTGSTFTGPLKALGGLSGSLTVLSDGTTPFIVAASGNPISVSTGSNGQIILSGTFSSFSPIGSSYVTIGSDSLLTAERSLTAGTGISIVDGGANSTVTLNVNNNIVATLTGSTFTGPLKALGGLSGSLTVLGDGLTPFIVASSGNQITVTTGSNGQIVLSGSFPPSGPPIGSSYVTIGNDASLTAERALTAGTGINIVDGGANSTVTLNINNNVVATLTGSTFSGPLNAKAGISGSLTVLSDGTTPFIVAASGNPISISTGSNGQIILSGTFSSFSPIGSSYVTIGSDSLLTAERSLTAGTGISIVDGGANSTVTLNVNNNVVATLTGSTFTGPLKTLAGISGSHTVLSDGSTPFIVSASGNSITITTGSNGQIILSGSFTPIGSSYVTIGNDASLTAERSLTAGTGISIVDGGANSTVTLNVNNNVIATLTGSTFTGPLNAKAGLSGSLTVLSDGSTPFIVAASGNPISISTGSNGQIILSGSFDSFSPIGSSYVTIGNDASLTAERSLTAGTGINIVDGGANSTVTLNINNNVVATLTGSIFTGPLKALGGLSGSLTVLSDGSTPFIVAATGNQITVTTGSNGQIVLSGSFPGPPIGSSYVTIGNDASLTAERALIAGTGINIVDGGANSTVTVNVNNNVVATLTGSVFTGPLNAKAGLSGSLTILSDGLTPFIVAASGNPISISTGSNGQIILSGTFSSFSPIGSSYVTIGNDSSLTAERSLTAGTGINIVDGGANSTVTLNVNNNVVATLTGSTFTGPLKALGGLSGSLTVLSDGSTPFIVASSGNPISISTGSNGQIILSGTFSSFSSIGSSYVTIGNDSSLTAERSLTAGSGISIVDGGANSTVTLNVNNNVVATLTGSTFTGPLKALGGLSGSLTVLSDGTTPFITAIGGTSIVTGSNGQLTLSSSIVTTAAQAVPAQVLNTFPVAMINYASIDLCSNALTMGGLIVPNASAVVNNMKCMIYQTGGSGDTQGALYNVNGNRLQITTAVTASSTGFVTMPFTSPVSLTAGTPYYLALSCTAMDVRYCGRYDGSLLFNMTPVPTFTQFNSRLPVSLSPSPSSGLLWISVY